MNTLHLTQKKKWFGMCESGVKREEYREIKPYWFERLVFDHKRVFKYFTCCDYNGKDSGAQYFITAIILEKQSMFGFNPFDNVIAKNGYSKDAPTIEWEHKGIRIGKPNPEWCEPEDIGKTVFILDIGIVKRIK